MHTALHLALTALLLSVAAATAQQPKGKAAPERRPSIRPKALLAPLAKAPTIDGVLAEGEWPTFHVARWVGGKDDFLAERAGEFWLGSDGERLFVAVRSAVHPKRGAITHAPARQEQEDADQLEHEDSLELWISRSAFGGAGEYQIMLTPAGAVWDERHTRDAAPAADRQAGWTAALTQAHRVQDGVWVAELALDLKSVGVTDISEPLNVRVCRNFQQPREQCRWAPRVVFFSAAQTMPTICFDARAPIISEFGFQDAAGIRFGVDLTNPTPKPLALDVLLSCQADAGQPGTVVEKTLELAPGATTRVELARPLEAAAGATTPAAALTPAAPATPPAAAQPADPAAPGIAFAELRVRAPKGSTFYHRDLRWRLRPAAPAWEE